MPSAPASIETRVGAAARLRARAFRAGGAQAGSDLARRLGTGGTSDAPARPRRPSSDRSGALGLLHEEGEGTCVQKPGRQSCAPSPLPGGPSSPLAIHRTLALFAITNRNPFELGRVNRDSRRRTRRRADREPASSRPRRGRAPPGRRLEGLGRGGLMSCLGKVANARRLRSTASAAAHRQNPHHEMNRRKCPRQESNLRTRFRKPLLYPLSYGGGKPAFAGTS